MAFTIKGTPVGFEAILVALIASMGGFLFGYDTGQISGILLMHDFKRRFASCSPDITNLDDCKFGVYREGLIVSLLSVGTLIGALSGAWIADKLGRRRAMTVEAIVFCVGVVIQVATFNAWEQIMMGRFVAGFGIGALSCAVPMYQAETAPKQIRGTLTVTYQFMITLGILTAAAINIGTNTLDTASSWRTPIGLGMFFAAFLGVAILFMPESPRWLLWKGRDEEAVRAIARIRGVAKHHGTTDPFVDNDFREVKASVMAYENVPDATWADCFRVKHKILYRTILGITLQSLQQLTGANYFFYYGATIFQGVGITNGFVVQIILNTVNVVCTFLGFYVLERFGRRLPLIIGGLWQSAWLFVFAGAAVAKDPSTNEGVGKLTIVAACMFILGFASTWGPGIWILIGETFPTRTRAKQGALATGSNWAWNFAISFFTQPITASIGFNYGFIFAACNLVGALVVYLFLYESSKLSLEAVDIMYNDPAVTARNSRTWAPPGYRHRNDAAAQEDKVDGATLVEHSSHVDDAEKGLSNGNGNGKHHADHAEKTELNATAATGEDLAASTGPGQVAHRDDKLEREDARSAGQVVTDRPTA